MCVRAHMCVRVNGRTSERERERDARERAQKRITDAARPFAAAISLIVFGQADKLSGIMPASQSINYERGGWDARASRAQRVSRTLNERARRERTSFWRIERPQPPTRPRSISLIIVSRFQVLHDQVTASSRKPFLSLFLNRSPPDRGGETPRAPLIRA